MKESKTVDAVAFTTRHSLSFTGVILRNETLIYAEYIPDGVINYLVEDGAKLSQKSEIARFFNSEDQIYYRYRIERLENEIDVLTKAQDKGTTDYAQLELISSRVNDEYKEILADITNGNLSKFRENRLDLLKHMCIYRVSSNAESSFETRISALEAELDKYEAALVQPVSTVQTTDSGYFTSVVDGYESELSIDGLSSITADKINSIIARPDKSSSVSPNVIGKVFSSYSWKMVGIIDTDDRYFVNQYFNVAFTSIEKTYRCFVEDIRLTGNGNQAIVVLSCEEMDADIAAARVLDAEILFGEYSGVKVPRTAIRFKDGQKGVYVLQGEKMIFRKLNVVYEGDDYVLSEKIRDTDYLQLYDRILLDAVPYDQGSEDEFKDEEPDADNTDDQEGVPGQDEEPQEEPDSQENQ